MVRSDHLQLSVLLNFEFQGGLTCGKSCPALLSVGKLTQRQHFKLMASSRGYHPQAKDFRPVSFAAGTMASTTLAHLGCDAFMQKRPDKEGGAFRTERCSSRARTHWKIPAPRPCTPFALCAPDNCLDMSAHAIRLTREKLIERISD